jgi:hypothetical protein
MSRETPKKAEADQPRSQLKVFSLSDGSAPKSQVKSGKKKRNDHNSSSSRSRVISINKASCKMCALSRLLQAFASPYRLKRTCADGLRLWEPINYHWPAKEFSFDIIISVSLSLTSEFLTVRQKSVEKPRTLNYISFGSRFCIARRVLFVYYMLAFFLSLESRNKLRSESTMEHICTVRCQSGPLSCMSSNFFTVYAKLAKNSFG